MLLALGLAVRDGQAQPASAPAAPAASQPALPVIVQADRLYGRTGVETVLEGHAQLSRGDVTIRADRLSFRHADELAHAQGHVVIRGQGNVFSGPELQLNLQTYEGFFSSPDYYFAQTGGGGHAQRLEFLGRQRLRATAATYTSCPIDGSQDPAWLLSADRVSMNFEANEGVAEGAVLRFYGVPILGAPVLSFPLTDARKSGWLPPNLDIDSRSGVQLAVPYYWNLAPNRDATLTPRLSTRRGPGIDTEFRYLEPRYAGEARLDLIPHDAQANRSRHAWDLRHEGQLPHEVRYGWQVLRVSDDSYWKDFPGAVPSLTPRLLPAELQANRSVERRHGDWTTYARVQHWQVLQDTDLAGRIIAPYQRSPQLGGRVASHLAGGLELDFEAEFNRFTNPQGVLDPARTTGLRLHALGGISRPWSRPGWTLTPRLSFNAASYSLDQVAPGASRSPSRIIPTVSVDSAWVLEREAQWFGHRMVQTLEPRLMYVNTPFRDQSALPNFDSAPKDFNFDSIYTENAFSGVDRVSDAHELTAGAVTRLIDPDTGAEALRLGLVQRYLFRDQRITAEGQPFTQRFSDLLLIGATNLVPRWTLQGAVQYSPELGRSTRSILNARYSPGPFRTVSATYRLARALSEQVELGWQWPVYGRARPGERQGSECAGTWYSVGRVNYSMRDSRITDSVVGFEYDAGCWIGRVVAERLSTGRSEAATRLMLQLELVGLSRLGSNPLQVLKDNIPGYRLLRDDDRARPAAADYFP